MVSRFFSTICTGGCPKFFAVSGNIRQKKRARVEYIMCRYFLHGVLVAFMFSFLVLYVSHLFCTPVLRAPTRAHDIPVCIQKFRYHGEGEMHDHEET